MLKAKQIKQMQMDSLVNTFRDVRDMIMFSSTGVDAITENKVRLGLRKKNIRLLQVKNTLMRRVLEQMGMNIKDIWTGSTVMAWGAGSLAELSKEVKSAFTAQDKTKDKVKYKAAVSDGQQISFEQALTMPTRAEAIGRVVSLFLSPAARLVSQLKGPGGQVAGQIKSLGEKKEEEGVPAEQPVAS